MAYQVLARKYRPQRFSDVAGQEHVTRTLGHALEQQRVAHGYIFSGHRGIGKTTIARILAMALNCHNQIGSPERPSPEPCGVCDSCKEIRAGNSLDVVEIDAATNRGIDEIRELRDAARYAPARDRYKIYLLDEAHQITDAAFNALLKTLEEPPEHVVFMMATTQPEDIPQTIRSRCQHFSFHAVKFDDIVAELTQIAANEGILADPQALALLAEAGDGSMRDALSIMDQAIASAPMVDGKPKLDGEEIRELMGTVPDAVFERILEAIGEGQSSAVMEELNRLLNAGNSPSQMARQLVRYLRNCLMAKLGGENTGLLQISGDERARAVRSANLFSEEDLTRFLQVILRTFDELNYRQEPRLHLELGLMKLVHLQRLLPLEQILSSLPAAGRPPAANPRPAQAVPGQAPRSAPPRSAPTDTQKSKPMAPSPFELDRQRKQSAEDAEEIKQPVIAPVEVAVSVPVAVEAPVEVAAEPEPLPVTPVETKAAETDLSKLRDAVAEALDEQGHNTAASLLAAGRWKLDEEGAIQVEVGVKKTMLGLTMNGEAWKIVREALRIAGATQKMTVVPGESSDPASAAPRIRSHDSIEAVALGNPLVRQAQELFHAEVRSVLDLRDKGKG
ncbi:MAG TPA: DNA polymerase III subunit gamma/tau [Acidobacteriaceae bacterium]|nr:DNA polymerase III subunit gamma/tau [Acidobacteriaceae bacterium]